MRRRDLLVGGVAAAWPIPAGAQRLKLVGFLSNGSAEAYDRHVLDLNTGTQRQPDYLAINPMGKVPAIKHGDALITEQVAIYLYMADLYPEAGLAPAIGDADRGPYLRWMAYYSACFEPAIYDRSQKREPGPAPTFGGKADSTMVRSPSATVSTMVLSGSPY